MKLLAALCLLISLPALAEPVCHTKRHRICRSQKVVRSFMAQHPCPSTGGTKRCKGYVVDHVKALCTAQTEEERQRLDSVDNMQWQTVAEAKAKDRWECTGREKD